MIRKLILPFLALAISYTSFGQILTPGTYQDRYYYYLNLKNNFEDAPINIYPSIIQYYHHDSLQWDIQKAITFNNDQDKKLIINDPQLQTIVNSEYASGINDGPLWTGKGLTTAISGGVSGKIKWLHFSLNPMIYWTQNGDFTIVEGKNNNTYLYPFEKMDWVLRYGNDPFAHFSWGQSEVRSIFKNFTIGISTQNIKWGPSNINPIILSKNAEGFPHIDIGTAKPTKTKIGYIETKAYWGLLRESDYFDSNPDNNNRYFNGLSFGYRPKWADQISIGFTRAMYTSTEYLESPVKDAFAQFSTLFNRGKNELSNGMINNDYYDQLFSITLRYNDYDHGFDTFIEFARNDFAGSSKDLLAQPDHTRGFTLGFSKAFDFIVKQKPYSLIYTFEHTSLDTYKNSVLRISPTYYTHGFLEHGYTNRGQLLGASAGPGGNSDYMDLSLLSSKNTFSFYYYRLRYNDDYFVGAVDSGINEFEDLEVEHIMGLYYTVILDHWIMKADLNIALHEHWQYLHDTPMTYNTQAAIRISYRLN